MKKSRECQKNEDDSPVAAVADRESKMNTPHDRATLQEILSITAGLFMSIGGISTLLMSGWYQSMPIGQSMKDAMMSSWWQTIMPQTYLSVMWIMAAVSLMAGITVIIASYRIHKEPERIRQWGFVVLIASIVGIFCASGFGIGGAILGIIAGASSLRKGTRQHHERLN
ncbi:MAG: hypothetical protein EPO62_06615 [Candidatus Nitrosotenuis sp.]|nr:MAG: hypothetical protein EPO62_06615 [Candidatus Nitrosotenuis sp.]